MTVNMQYYLAFISSARRLTCAILRRPAIALAILSLRVFAQDTQPTPTYLVGASIFSGHSLVFTLFPSTGPPLSLPFHKDFPGSIYTRDATAVYGGKSHGLQKLDLASGNITPVSDLVAFRDTRSLAVSSHEDMLVVYGELTASPEGNCGIYQVSLPGGQVRKLLDGQSCDQFSGWNIEDISPDSKSLLIKHNDAHLNSRGEIHEPTPTHGHDLEVMDLETLRHRIIDTNVSAAAWSPDGRWVAIIQETGRSQEYVLLDPDGFRPRRSLGGAADGFRVSWSPDSYYLLTWQRNLLCDPGGYVGSMAALDIRTGHRKIVRGTRCRITTGGAAWIDEGVYAAAKARASTAAPPTNP